ncbi:MAG: MFS transporter [Nitrososphaeria archaeon]
MLSVFISFVIFHYADKLLISFLTPSIMNEFEITYTEMGMVLTGSLIVASLLYPTWGYLYDKYSRTKLMLETYIKTFEEVAKKVGVMLSQVQRLSNSRAK